MTNTISKCVSIDGASGAALCTACDTGYYLNSSTNTCTVGAVLNCKAYTKDSSTVCTSCLDNFTLVALDGGRYYCVPFDPKSKCTAFDTGSSNGLLGKVYTCTQCAFSDSFTYGVKTYSAGTTKAVSVCSPLGMVDKCSTYSVDTSSSVAFNTNTFGCSKCFDGYYLASPFNCTARINLSGGCTKYVDNADKCLTCTATTFLSSDATVCVSFPNGILGCGAYTNDTTCIACNAPRYLVNNTCIASTVINNCANYTANYTCSGCKSGFFLANSTACVTPTAQNCLTYAAINTCATCGAKMGTQITGTTTNCVSNSVNNCAVSTTQAPFTCTQCNPGFYVSDAGACVGVTNTIAYCLIYKSATLCSQCSAPYALSVNQTSCTNVYNVRNDANCAITTLLPTASCAQCALGSYFVNGTCTSCQNSNTGCLTCDADNQSTCLACQSGYYQNANGTCISVSGQNNGGNTGNGGSGTTPDADASNKITVAGLFSLFVVLFSVLF